MYKKIQKHLHNNNNTFIAISYFRSLEAIEVALYT